MRACIYIYIYSIHIYIHKYGFLRSRKPEPERERGRRRAKARAMSSEKVSSSGATSTTLSSSPSSPHVEFSKGVNGLDKVVLRESRGSSAEVFSLSLSLSSPYAEFQFLVFDWDLVLDSASEYREMVFFWLIGFISANLGLVWIFAVGSARFD